MNISHIKRHTKAGVGKEWQMSVIITIGCDKG